MNEKAVKTAICEIEQKLLLEDHSPSIHDQVEKIPEANHTNVISFLHSFLFQDDNFDAVISSYSEFKELRKDLERRDLLHHLIRVKDMVSVKESTNPDSQSDLNDGT